MGGFYSAQNHSGHRNVKEDAAWVNRLNSLDAFRRFTPAKSCLPKKPPIQFLLTAQKVEHISWPSS